MTWQVRYSRTFLIEFQRVLHRREIYRKFP